MTQCLVLLADESLKRPIAADAPVSVPPRLCSEPPPRPHTRPDVGLIRPSGELVLMETCTVHTQTHDSDR